MPQGLPWEKYDEQVPHDTIAGVLADVLPSRLPAQQIENQRHHLLRCGQQSVEAMRALGTTQAVAAHLVPRRRWLWLPQGACRPCQGQA